MILTKKNLENAKSNPFYKAFNLYPGNFLLEKWKDSQAQAIKDIETLENEDLKKKLLKEVCAIVTPGAWIIYIVRKYGESFVD